MHYYIYMENTYLDKVINPAMSIHVEFKCSSGVEGNKTILQPRKNCTYIGHFAVDDIILSIHSWD